MIVSTRIPWGRMAAVGALVAALGLSACGRKGPLDPPPSAGAAPEASAAMGYAQPVSAQPQANFNAEAKADVPPPSRRQPFFLDWLVE